MPEALPFLVRGLGTNLSTKRDKYSNLTLLEWIAECGHDLGLKDLSGHFMTRLPGLLAGPSKRAQQNGLLPRLSADAGSAFLTPEK